METPRDRNGSYEPKIIGKVTDTFRYGFLTTRSFSMYARGMSTREIQGHLEGDLQKVESESGADFQRHRSGDVVR